MVSSDIERHTSIGSLGIGFYITRELAKNFFNSMKIFSKLSSQLKRQVLLSNPIIGFIFSAIFGMNRDSVINLCALVAYISPFSRSVQKMI